MVGDERTSSLPLSLDLSPDLVPAIPLPFLVILLFLLVMPLPPRSPSSNLALLPSAFPTPKTDPYHTPPLSPVVSSGVSLTALLRSKDGSLHSFDRQ